MSKGMFVKSAGPGIAAYAALIDEDFADQVMNTALVIERVAKENAPVDTGNLRNSIHAQEEPEGASVSTNVEYAPAQEYGTRNMPGRHYFEAGIRAGEQYIENLRDLGGEADG